MNTKVTFCCVLFSLFCLSLAEHVNLRVETVTTIATTDEDFVCATLDWWPSTKCNYNQCPWGNAGVLTLDFGNKIITNAIKAFSPLRIRLGGSLEDQIIYQFGRQKEYPVMKKKHDGLFGFSEGCLPKKKWDEMNHFFNKTGVKFTFGLNALIGKKNSKIHKGNWEGDWNPTNAISLMEYTMSKGYKIDSYELGNELCSGGVSARVDGPGGFYGKDWFDSFLQNVEPGVVDGVTHHIYNLGAGDDKNLIHKVQDPFYLSKIAQTFKDVSVAVNEYSPSAGAWVGESGGSYNSGGKDVSNTFVNGFWYLDQLGMTSTFNHKVYCRQALVGGNYALLNTTTFIPKPDYYGALLWHRLMGNKVLSVFHEGSSYLRVYAHCSKKEPGITVLLINMSNSTSFQVSLENDMNLYPSLEAVKRKTSKPMREEYHLTPKDGNLQSDVVLLNGTPLKLTKSKDIPAMKPKLVDEFSPINVKSDSIVFVHSNEAKAMKPKKIILMFDFLIGLSWHLC
uniref:Heparanase-like protein 2 n=1 Tax=Cajanus cajan TaxID=3821 RepID=A0A151RGV9_CAJCA|nr:Heparanase-like protein 2 [Cajanus cajan]